MIKNERQYNILRVKLAVLASKKTKLKAVSTPSISQQIVLATTISIMAEIEQEIKEYEKLKDTRKIQLQETTIDQLPRLIIEYKIANHLSTKEFAKQLNIPERQLQRHEATGFKKVSFEKLIIILKSINLNLKVIIG